LLWWLWLLLGVLGLGGGGVFLGAVVLCVFVFVSCLRWAVVAGGGGSAAVVGLMFVPPGFHTRRL
ncbi:hypothetical protein ABT173_48625, partial [Streptomyces sp. NPDC001795]|uniref:hypothetical protein n=1 Tax=Streptomyces sp. NPDC001795 TaxID=3154525 RepID=UPI0033207045